MTLPDLTAKGSLAGGAADVTVVSRYDGETDTAEELAIGPDRYLRFGVKSKDFEKSTTSSNPTIRAATKLFDGKTWFKIDPKRLKAALLTLDLDDITGLGQLLDHASADLGTVQQMTGSVNFAPAHGQHRLVDFDAIKQSGDLQPFTAALDPQGRLRDIKSDTEPVIWHFAFTGYDNQQPPPAPARAPALPTVMYQFVND